MQTRIEKAISGLKSCFSDRFKILAYHSIAPTCRNRYEVSDRVFRDQMDYLATHNYHILGLQEAFDNLQMNSIKPKTVVITFDDGCRSLRDYAFPVLAKYKWPAMVFLPVAKVGGQFESVDLLDWSDAGEAMRQGIAFGSHTMTHRNLIALSREDLEYELAESRRLLAEKLGVTFFPLAYPYGYFDARVADACRRCGYDIALTFGSILSNTRRTNPFEMKREQVLGSTSLQAFARKVDVRCDLPRKMWHMVVPE